MASTGQPFLLAFRNILAWEQKRKEGLKRKLSQPRWKQNSDSIKLSNHQECPLFFPGTLKELASGSIGSATLAPFTGGPGGKDIAEEEAKWEVI